MWARSSSRAWAGSTSSGAVPSWSEAVEAAAGSLPGAAAVDASTVPEAAWSERVLVLEPAPEQALAREQVLGPGEEPAAAVPARPRRERGPVRERVLLAPQRSRAVRLLP